MSDDKNPQKNLFPKKNQYRRAKIRQEGGKAKKKKNLPIIEKKDEKC